MSGVVDALVGRGMSGMMDALVGLGMSEVTRME